MLDELPYGNFVEIEGEAVSSIKTVAAILRLKWDTSIPASYHILFEQLCARYPNLDRTDLSFNALKGLDFPPADLSVHAAEDWSETLIKNSFL